MYRHVIVPFDGVLEHRAVLAPAGDLAWRFGAKVVVVATNESDDDDVRAVLKTQAMSRSGSDADFWVDLGVDIGPALVAAAENRPDPLICVATRHRRAGVLRRRHPGTTALPVEVFERAPCPVVVVGPNTDTSRGLPVTTLYVPLGDEAGGDRAVELALGWATALRVDVHLLAMVPPGVEDTGPPPDAMATLERVKQTAPASRLEVIQTERPAAALAAIASEDPDGLVVLGRTGGDGRDPLGPFAAEVVGACARAVLFAAPTSV